MEALAVIRDYADLRQFIARRRRDLGLSQLAVDEIAGIQSGYLAKLEIGTRHFGDISFGCVLGALGVALIAVPAAGSNGKELEETKRSLDNRKKLRKDLAAKGGRARAAKMSSEQRRRSAQKAAKSRWRNWREVKAAKEEKERRAARKKQDAASLSVIP
jgi:transcriptional regulator with XRE-family HTH domain